nr:MAG TPA: Putative transcription antitermination protein nusG Regulation, Spt4, Spt5, NusG.9A [Caudoviricetes sp.]
MIKPVTMYSVVCDRCGKPFIDEFNGIVAWLDEELQKSKQWRANGWK